MRILYRMGSLFPHSRAPVHPDARSQRRWASPSSRSRFQRDHQKEMIFSPPRRAEAITPCCLTMIYTAAYTRLRVGEAGSAADRAREHPQTVWPMWLSH
jgi:hypothetical protein